MGAHAGRPQLQSLADWLAALGAGDPCPWCGARLEVAGRARQVMGLAATTTEGQVAQGALVCAACGCEVATVDEAAEAGRRILHHAA